MNLNNSPRAIHEYELQPERLFKFKFMNYALIMMSLETPPRATKQPAEHSLTIKVQQPATAIRGRRRQPREAEHQELARNERSRPPLLPPSTTPYYPILRYTGWGTVDGFLTLKYPSTPRDI